MRSGFLGLVGFAAALALSSGSAEAHKLKVFAAVDGDGLAGYAYFVPGGRAPQAAVTLETLDGKPVARTTSDDEGGFRFSVGEKVAYRLTVAAEDGHAATTTIAAEELPERLSGAENVQDLRTYLDHSLARQILPLRAQIDAYQEKIWWHDVMGGLGALFGFGGVAFGLAERRKRLTETGKERP